MINEIQIRCFMEVADRLSFTRAASHLFITQQACSKYIAALETEWGFPLFVRSTRKVILTEDGKKLYSIFSRFKTEFDTAIQVGQQHYAAQELNLSFGLMNGTNPSVLVDGIKLLKELFPQIKLNWCYGELHELIKKVISNEYQVALVFKEGANAFPSLAWRRIFRFHSYVLLAAHLTDDAENIPYDLLASLPFAAHVQFGLTEEESLADTRSFLKMVGLPCNGIHLYETVNDAIADVVTGESYTVTPPVFQHAFYSPYLNKYPLLHHTAAIGCIWNSRNRNPYLEKIVDTLAESVRNTKFYSQFNVPETEQQ